MMQSQESPSVQPPHLFWRVVAILAAAAIAVSYIGAIMAGKTGNPKFDQAIEGFDKAMQERHEQMERAK